MGEILKTEFLVPLETCFSQLHMIHSHISHIRACSFFYSESPKFPPAPASPGYSSLLPDLISRTATASPNHHFILVPSTSIFRYHPIRLFSPPLHDLPQLSVDSATSTLLELFSSISPVLAETAINFSAIFDTVVNSLLHGNFLGLPYSKVYWFSSHICNPLSFFFPLLSLVIFPVDIIVKSPESHHFSLSSLGYSDVNFQQDTTIVSYLI